MSMYPYKRPKHTRVKIVSSVRNFVWTVICLVGAILIVALLIKWCAPWLSTLGKTVMQ
ncbi:MAG: hypothetical protein QME60_01725 [Verrucomicrobiota bacterium]|nr:hypothetical protein [Verrucomicrobiota bacterium]